MSWTVIADHPIQQELPMAGNREERLRSKVMDWYANYNGDSPWGPSLRSAFKNWQEDPTVERRSLLDELVIGATNDMLAGLADGEFRTEILNLTED